MSLGTLHCSPPQPTVQHRLTVGCPHVHCSGFLLTICCVVVCFAHLILSADEYKSTAAILIYSNELDSLSVAGGYSWLKKPLWKQATQMSTNFVTPKGGKDTSNKKVNIIL